mmetsp:Transcript_1789/g.5207  ORF Transcript_1789/g.5207 Transcript_1789/m.5207 type:complete len:217 (+) Transcript_1789:220-870(+)
MRIWGSGSCAGRVCVAAYCIDGVRVSACGDEAGHQLNGCRSHEGGQQVSPGGAGVCMAGGEVGGSLRQPLLHLLPPAVAAVKGEQHTLSQRAGAHDHVTPGTARHGVDPLKHCRMQRCQVHPVWRVLEAGGVQYEDLVPCRMVASYWAEVAVTSLFELLAGVRHDHVPVVAGGGGRDVCPEIVHTRRRAVHLHLRPVASRQACCLGEGYAVTGNLR